MDDASGEPAERFRAPTASMPVRGRDRELEAIDRLVGRVAGGGCGVLVLEGSAGFGKSRLVAEVGVSAQRSGVRFSSWAAEPTEGESSYATLLSALTAAPDPVLGGEAVNALRANRNDRYWFLMDIAGALEESSAKRPLIVALDDLHWADVASLEAVRILCTRLSSSPIGWVLAFRANHDSPALTRLVVEAKDAAAAAIALAPLDREAVDSVLHDHFEADPPASLIASAERAEGVPFFLIELIHGVVNADATSDALSSDPGDGSSLPARTAASIAGRIDGLGPPAARAAQAGAVLGRRFRTDDVAALLGCSVMAAIETLGTLVRAQVLVPDGSRWLFRHDIVREAVLDALAEPTRSAMERAAADVLIAAGIAPEDVARRVAITARLGDERALRILSSAARALVSTDPGAASDLYRAAMRIVEPGDPRRVTFGLSAVVGLHLAARSGEALRLAEDVAGDASDPDQLAQLQLSLATMYSLPGDVRVEHGRRGLAVDGVSAVLRARHLGVLVLSTTATGDLDAAERLAGEATALIDATDDDTARLHLAFGRMTLDEATYRYRPALDRLSQIRALGAAVGDRAPALGAEWLRANVLVSLDQYQRAWDVASEGLADSRERNQAWIASRWEFWQGWYLLQAGRLSDARAVLEGAVLAEGLEVATALPDAVGVAALGTLARHLGDHRLQRRCARIARSTLASGRSDDACRHLRWYLVAELLAQGDSEGARGLLVEAGAGPIPMPVLAVDVGAEIRFLRAAQAVGDVEMAGFFTESAATRAALNPDVESLRAAADHARGLLLADVDSLASAARTFDPQRRPLLAMSANEDLGESLILQGRSSDAVAPLLQALELATASGAVHDGQRLRWRLRSLGVQRRLAPAGRPKRGWEALTPAEVAVAEQVGGGASNRAAAEHLFLSPHTVSAHLRHVFEKLSITSRHDLVRLLAERDHGDRARDGGAVHQRSDEEREGAS